MITLYRQAAQHLRLENPALIVYLWGAYKDTISTENFPIDDTHKTPVLLTMNLKFVHSSEQWTENLFKTVWMAPCCARRSHYLCVYFQVCFDDKMILTIFQCQQDEKYFYRFDNDWMRSIYTKQIDSTERKMLLLPHSRMHSHCSTFCTLFVTIFQNNIRNEMERSIVLRQ